MSNGKATKAKASNEVIHSLLATPKRERCVLLCPLNVRIVNNCRMFFAVLISKRPHIWCDVKLLWPALEPHGIISIHPHVRRGLINGVITLRNLPFVMLKNNAILWNLSVIVRRRLLVLSSLPIALERKDEVVVVWP